MELCPALTHCVLGLSEHKSSLSAAGCDGANTMCVCWKCLDGRCALGLSAGGTPKASGASYIPEHPCSASCLFPIPQNIRVWDMLDYICLQSFCGKFFALGNCPITSAYFFEKDNTLICSTYSVSAVPGGSGVEATGRGPGSESHETPKGWPRPVPPGTAEVAGLCGLAYEGPCLGIS